MTADIWFGDVARAFRALSPQTPDERSAIAGLLGFSRAATPDRFHQVVALEPSQPVEASGSSVHGGAPVNHPTVERRPAVESSASTEQQDQVMPAEPSPTQHRPARRAGQLQTIRLVGYEPIIMSNQDIASLAPAPTTRSYSMVPDHVPLLAPESSRAVLQALLARESSDGPIDVAALVNAVATRRLAGLLPRQPVRTLRFGVQVLVDEGDGMTLFTRDQDHVVQQVRNLVGIDRTNVEYFTDAPLRGVGSSPLWTLKPYHTPPTGTRILLLSHLGIGGRWIDPSRSERSEWEEFASAAAWHGCEVIALVPYPSVRWPSWMTRLFTIVTWDRALTVSRASTAAS